VCGQSKVIVNLIKGGLIMQTFRNLMSCLLIAGLIAVFCTTSEAQNGSLQENLILRFRFEGEGNIAADASGNGNDGTIVGAVRVPGRFGKGIAIGPQDEYIQISNVLQPAGTIEFWFKPNWDGSSTETFRLFDANTGAIYYMISKGKAIGDREDTFGFYLEDASDADFQDWETPATDAIPAADQWYHLTTTWDFDAGEAKFYINGEEVGSVTGLGNFPPLNANPTIGFNSDAGYMATSNGADGIIDEFSIYAKAITAEEIQVVMRGVGDYPFAYSPNPKDGTLHPDTWINLGWTPGDFAVSHNVYLGDNFDDVDAGAESTFVGNQTDTFTVAGFPGFPYPDGLVPGTTYYWRIDEVNDAEPNSPWKGEIWSFSIPPKTAYFPDPADGAEAVGVNDKLTWTPGFGSKLHYVYFGETFNEVENAAGGLPQGAATFSPVTLKMAKTYYWRVDEFDIVETHKGDVWSFTTEGAVAALDPANGAVDVTQTPVLTWTPGFGASHEVYFGADPTALELKGSGNLGSESYEPGQLEWDTTYYWRIDEANNANADSPWTGPLWSFTTANFLIVDDFESYNDLDPAEPESNRIFNAWIDGYDDPTNGSLVGYETPPFAEQTIVHSGNQSMPMSYDNSVGKSEATLTLTSNRDWTVKGVDTLTIWFRGDAANAAETMYVVLNGSAGIDHDNPDAALRTSWTAWNIDLQSFADQGVNLANVDSITLGLSSVTGGTGMMYFDDIRLYPPAQ
jgi:hypothetical protein